MPLKLTGASLNLLPGEVVRVVSWTQVEQSIDMLASFGAKLTFRSCARPKSLASVMMYQTGVEPSGPNPLWRGKVAVLLSRSISRMLLIVKLSSVSRPPPVSSSWPL